MNASKIPPLSLKAHEYIKKVEKKRRLKLVGFDKKT